MCNLSFRLVLTANDKSPSLGKGVIIPIVHASGEIQYLMDSLDINLRNPEGAV